MNLLGADGFEGSSAVPTRNMNKCGEIVVSEWTAVYSEPARTFEIDKPAAVGSDCPSSEFERCRAANVLDLVDLVRCSTSD